MDHQTIGILGEYKDFAIDTLIIFFSFLLWYLIPLMILMILPIDGYTQVSRPSP